MIGIVRKLKWENPNETKLEIEKFLQTNGFVIHEKSGIHSEHAFKFLKELCCADDWTLNLCKYGVSLETDIKDHEVYYEKNNSSAIKYMSALREKTKEWLNEGYLEKLTSQPKITSPMTVNPEYNDSGELKKLRPCIDLSRYLNKRTKRFPLKMDTLP